MTYFAVTYHKLQGLTLKKLILSINKHPNHLLRLALSSLYVGISRVKHLHDIRVLPYGDEDVDYLASLQFDDLLKAWLQNYTKKGRWKYDGFKNFERHMLQKTKIDLGLVDDLQMLTIQECKAYLSKLDIIATGTKVAGLRSALSESYSQGRDLLKAGNGMLLLQQRILLYKKLKKQGDYKKISLSCLRHYGKRLGISYCHKMGKYAIISALKKFEATHCAGMFPSKKPHATYAEPVVEIGDVAISLDKLKDIRTDHVEHMAKRVRKRRRLNVSRTPVNMEPNICDNQQQRCLTQRYKGLVNLGNTCYFNSVIQCLLHCPLTKTAIENVSPHTHSNKVLHELRILFMMMMNNDALMYLSPSQCFNAVMRTAECKSVHMGDGRQHDAHAFFVKLMEHFEKDLKDNKLTADTFKLLAILNIPLRSTTTYQQCTHSYEKNEYLWQFSLYFPNASDEDIPDTLDISYLLKKYHQREIIHQASCPQCGVVGLTVKNLNIINAPQVLVIHLSRFHGGTK